MSLFTRSVAAAATAASAAALSADATVQEEVPMADTDTPVDPVPENLPVDDAGDVTPAADPSKDPLDKVVDTDTDPEAAPPEQVAETPVATADATALESNGGDQVIEGAETVEQPVAEVLEQVTEPAVESITAETVVQEEAPAPVDEAPTATVTNVTEPVLQEGALESAAAESEVTVEDNAVATEALNTASPTAEGDNAVVESIVVEASATQAVDSAAAAAVTAEAPIEQVEQSAEVVTAEATPTAELEQVATVEASSAESAARAVADAELAEGLNVLGQVKIVRASSSKAPAVLIHADQMNVLGRRTAELASSLRSMEMVLNFTQVAKDHQLSAPLVAAFRATPGFDAAVANFPATSLFNIVPEHASSASNQSGLESFNETTVSLTDDVKAKTQGVVDAFKVVLDTLGVTVDNLSAQVNDDKASLEDSDITDEVLATLPVYTLSNMAFTEVLGKLDVHLRAVDLFNIEDLKAHPEKLPEQIDAIGALVTDIGAALGLKLDGYGLNDADKDEAYEPTKGDFGSKDITKSSLAFYLEQSSAILDVLKVLADRKDDIVDAMQGAVTDMPEAVESDDVTYGCVEHVTLLSCYATLLTKLVRESIVVVSMVLTAVDAALDIDMGDDEVVEVVEAPAAAE